MADSTCSAHVNVNVAKHDYNRTKGAIQYEYKEKKRVKGILV